MADPKPPGTYDVGYARPPVQHRFAKGRTGNARGRPRKRPSLYEELKAVLAEKITLSIAGEPTAMTVQQALIHRLREMAVAGDTMASKLVVRLESQLPAASASRPEDIRVLMFHAGLLAKRVTRGSSQDAGGRADG